MSKTENQTRKEIIVRKLNEAGWNVSDPSQVSLELDIWVGLLDVISVPKNGNL